MKRGSNCGSYQGLCRVNPLLGCQRNMIWPNHWSCITLHCCAVYMNVYVSCIFLQISIILFMWPLNLKVVVPFIRTSTSFCRSHSQNCTQWLKLSPFSASKNFGLCAWKTLPFRYDAQFEPCFTRTWICLFAWQTFELCWYVCSSSFQPVSMAYCSAVCDLWNCCLVIWISRKMVDSFQTLITMCAFQKAVLLVTFCWLFNLPRDCTKCWQCRVLFLCTSERLVTLW